jgi:ATP-dependent DNA helicase RecG
MGWVLPGWSSNMTMKPSLAKLEKFFKLEIERNYDNHAVVGGLDRMLDRWEAEARSDRVSEEIIQLVISRIRDYPRLSEASRADVLEGIWKRIVRSEGLTSDHANLGVKAPHSETKSADRNSQGSRSKVENQPTPKNARNDTNLAPLKSQNTGQVDQGEIANDQPISEMGSPQAAVSAPTQAVPASPAVPPIEPAALNASVTVLPGVGPKHAETLARLDLRTLRDMLYYLPKRYDDYSQLKPINRLEYGEEVTVIGTVQSVATRNIRGGKTQIVEAVIYDGTGALRLTWFNQAWIGKRLRPKEHIVVSGKIDHYLGRNLISNAEWEPLEQQQLSTNRIVPVYPLTANITQRWLRKMINGVVEYWAPRVPDMLPAELRLSAGVMPISQALLQVHFPDTFDSLTGARYRLAFDEIFLLQLGVLQQKRSWQERSAREFSASDDWINEQIALLPFPLTGAQQRVIQDIRHDLSSGRPMNRLLQGDVGSGKTVVAALGIAIIVREGAQAAIMAPTSILAEQHYRNLTRLLSITEALPASDAESAAEPDAATFIQKPLLPEQIRLIIGATPEAEKREIRAGLADGSIRLVIGTHALLEDPVKFADLQFVVIDEQHRFGVEQRAILRSKGTNPHLLVMTATPIPRSLALTIYGDLDLSVMDEMPPGRQVISTHAITPRERERAYSLIRGQVSNGLQAFIIYPLIEESDNNEAKAAVEEHARLQKEIFPNLRLGLLHGKMRAEEKDEVMAQFRNGMYQILVSTTVVEVGVDIPNATVMLVESANRFGLAQLHQLRGRVGRGAEKAYCILIPDTNETLENERLQVMSETNDGFVLAERDLQQRGPGQFLGTRQSGFSELQMASLTNVHLIENARKHAQSLFETNPELAGTEFAALNSAFERFWKKSLKGDVS